MRRKDKSIEELALQEEIIRRSQVCRLGLCDDGQPYVVPLNFGYEKRVIYFHSALSGRKIDILKRNNRVCVEFDLPGALETNEIACKWGMHFQSVIAFGHAELVRTDAEKQTGLNLIMAHYNGNASVFPEKSLAGVAVIRVTIDTMTAKRG